MNTNGTCFADSPDLAMAFMVTSCLNGWRTNLKVPSGYQHVTRARMSSCSCFANVKCFRSLTLTSARKNPVGMQPSSSSKSISVGSLVSVEGGEPLSQYALA